MWKVLGLAGMVLTCFVAACVVLGFGFVAETVANMPMFWLLKPGLEGGERGFGIQGEGYVRVAGLLSEEALSHTLCFTCVFLFPSPLKPALSSSRSFLALFPSMPCAEGAALWVPGSCLGSANHTLPKTPCLKAVLIQ